MNKLTLLPIIVLTFFFSCKTETSKKEDTSKQPKTTEVKVEKGLASPVFELEDINGYLVSLNDFKGKLVYIDLWATWCIPCLKEVPSLQGLEEKYRGQDIVFVSMCIKDKKVLWETLVKERGFTGVQVFDPNENSDFIKAYNIESIPRFIFIDKEGKIIDDNALPPSNPQLQEQIEEYL